MNTLSGCDISHDQGTIDWSTFKNNVNFVLIQSSFGVGNFDAMYGYNKGQVLNTSLPHGYYHFAYPTLNAATDEANWFVHALSAVAPLQQNESLYLDLEGTMPADPVTWALDFLNSVYQQTTVRPILYTEQSILEDYDFTPVVKAGFALWIAAPTNDPTNNNFETGAFPDAVMQQWGTENIPGVTGIVDADLFFGTLAEFQAYGYQPPKPVTPVVVTPTPAPSPAPTPVPTPTPQPTPNPPQSPTTPPNPTPVPVDPNIAKIANLEAELQQATDTITKLQTTLNGTQAVLSAIHTITYKSWGLLLPTAASNLHAIKKIFEKGI